MIPVLKSISDLLCRDQVTLQNVSKALGDVIGGGERGVAVKVRPKDPAVQDARVVREGESDGVSHVDLTPARPFPMSDLIAAFGAYHTVARSTNPNKPPRVRFDVRPPGMAHSAAIYASYEEGDHGASDGTVIALMVRRD
jgi:hypothetical protein